MKRALWGIGLLLAIAAVDFVLPRVVNAYIIQIAVLCGINIVLAVSLNLINGFTGQFSIGHAGFMAVGAYGAAMFTLHVGQRDTHLLADEPGRIHDAVVRVREHVPRPPRRCADRLR